jgi:hypothetical protein
MLKVIYESLVLTILCLVKIVDSQLPIPDDDSDEVETPQPAISEDGDDEDDDSPLVQTVHGENEDDIRRSQRINTVAALAELRLQPIQISRHMIPLCRLVVMPMVRPTLQCDLVKLEQEFVHGYREGACVFYVSLTNEQGVGEHMSSKDRSDWGPIWQSESDKFDLYLDSQDSLRFMKGKMFFICDGNHRRIAWMNHITRLYANDQSWHYSVDTIILETKGRVGMLLNVMNDINK